MFLRDITCLTSYSNGNKMYLVDRKMGLFLICTYIDGVIVSDIIASNIGLNSYEVILIDKVGTRFIFVNISAEISCYDLKTGVVKTFNTSDCRLTCVRTALCIKEKIYLIPRKPGEGIYVFDLISQKFVDYIEILTNNVELEEKIIFGGYFLEGRIWFVFRGTNIIGLLNILTRKVELVEIDNIIDNIFVSKGNIWLSFFDKNEIISMNSTFGINKRYNSNTLERINNRIRIESLIEVDGEIILLSPVYSKIAVINESTGEEDMMMLRCQLKDPALKLFKSYVPMSDGYLFLPCATDCFLLYSNKVFKEISNKVGGLLAYKILCNNINREETKIDLIDFLRVIVNF